MSPYLSDSEVNDICDGLQQPAAMIRFLRHAGFTVMVKPNGRPLLSRDNFHHVMNGTAAASAKKVPAEGNVAGLLKLVGRKHVAA